MCFAQRLWALKPVAVFPFGSMRISFTASLDPETF